MAAYTIDPDLVQAASGTNHLAGVDISAGELLYLDTADSNKAKLAINSSSAAALVEGFAVNTAKAGQPVGIQKSGAFTTGVVSPVLAVGKAYVLGDVAGQMMDAADLGSADYVTYIGVAASATVVNMALSVSGLAQA